MYKVTGTSDNGDPIVLDALPAYNYFDDPGVQKQLTAGQVLSTFPEPNLIGLTGFSDFTIPQLQNVQPLPGYSGDGTLWNTALWNTSQWSRSGKADTATTKGWQNVAAFGFAVTMAVQMRVQSQAVVWRQTGIRYRLAGAQ